jgi:hypothetical protein
MLIGICTSPRPLNDVEVDCGGVGFLITNYPE